MTPPTELEREQIARLRQSLEGWALGDVKKAASEEVDLPRLAFVGLAAWIDTLTYLRFGKNKPARDAWAGFFREYLPERTSDSELLRVGLRNKLLHEYGTRDIALTHGEADAHWTTPIGGLRIVNLDSLISELETAYNRFLVKIEEDPDLRRRVLDRSTGLLAPVTLGTTSASLTTSETIVTFPQAIAASATGPADVPIAFDEPGSRGQPKLTGMSIPRKPRSRRRRKRK